MSGTDRPTMQGTFRRQAGRRLARAAAIASAGLVIAGFVGQALRDRSVATALLMYIPLPMVGAAAVATDVVLRGRSVPWLRFGPAGLGLAEIAWSLHGMIGSGITAQAGPGDSEVSVLQWNVQWGGGLFRSSETWAAQRRAIGSRAPDLAVLSEAPPGDWIDRLVVDLGPGASYVGIHHDPRSPYWYRMVVCSRWPVQLDERLVLPGGSAMSVTAEVRGRRVRLLVVDGVSSPTRSRLPFLRAIAAACRDAGSAGRPYDLVLGDFNTPSRSLGFDELEALGYCLAGRSARGWRGTFPAWLPVYDIDHVWLGAGHRPASAAFFNGPSTDHRGQVVRILLPKEPPP
jgi:endonuclease/exonuclease/phosphatase family metal-dependent hydrolase